jgi:tetratricopeptide (TPR) repeat protein
MIRYALGFVVALAVAAGSYAGGYTQEQIRQAIKDLGSTNFRVRDAASQTLWLAGANAEPLLRGALKSSDPEVLHRARTILEKFSWGIFPDTPEEIVRQIDVFREGEHEERLKAVDQLLRMGKPGFDTLRRIAEKESLAAEKQAIFEHIAREAQVALPGLIAASDFANVKDLLERCLLGGSDEAFTNYAAFQVLDGKLPEAIDRWEKTWRNAKSITAAKLLVHLYRAKGNFPKAREFAKKIDDSMVEQVLWEEGDWKALSELLKKTQLSAHDATALGMRAAVHRMAGDRTAFDTAISQLRSLARTDDSFLLRSVAESLLLNGRTDDAMKILFDTKLAPALTFELLFTRMRYREALELAKAIRPMQKDESFRLQLRYARALHMLGETEQSKRQFADLEKGLKSAGEASSARDLVRTLSQLNLKERAHAVAAQYLSILETEKRENSCIEVLEPLFDRDAEIAAEWWLFLREKLTNSGPEQCMKLAEQILEGKNVEHRDEWAEELCRLESAKEWPREGNPSLAAAVAMLRAGKEEKARAYFELAIKKEPKAAVAIQYADHLAAHDRHQEAAEWYRRAGNLEPGNALALFLRGVALSKAGDAKEGKRLIELAHWVLLGDEYQRGELVKELERRGFADDAKREINLLLTFGWYRYWHMGNIISESAHAARQAHDYSRAIAAQEKAIAGCMWKAAGYVEMRAYLTVPRDVELLRIRTLLEAGRYDEALPSIRASLDVLPGDQNLTIVAVNSLDAAGRKKDADELFQMTLGRYKDLCAQFPNCAFGHYRYGLLAASCGRDLDDALTHAQTAVRLASNNTGMLDALAEVHFRRGDSKKAIALMNQCAESEPQNSFYRKQLVRYQSGDRKAAMPEQDD